MSVRLTGILLACSESLIRACWGLSPLQPPEGEAPASTSACVGEHRHIRPTAVRWSCPLVASAVAMVCLLWLVPAQSNAATVEPAAQVTNASEAKPGTPKAEAPQAEAPKEVIEDRWYMLQMQGQRAGHMHARVVRAGDITTMDAEIVIAIKRVSSNLQIKMESQVRERDDGTPLSMKSVMNLGSAPMVNEYVFKPAPAGEAEDKGTVEHRVTMNGKTTTLELPWPDGGEAGWTGPIAAGRQLEKAVQAGEKSITARTLDPSMGVQVITQTHTIVDRATIELLGKAVPAVKWVSTIDIMPGLETVEYADEKGRMLKSEMTIGGIRLDMVQTEKELALADVDPPELMAATLVKVPEPIKNARTLRKASYLLSAKADAGTKAGTLPDLPTTSVQRVERVKGEAAAKTGPQAGGGGADGPGGVRVLIDLDSPRPAPKADAENPAYLKSTSQADTTDSKVRELLDKALGDLSAEERKDQARVAEALRSFVHEFIDDKNLDVGFASASEVARTGQGDCSEHGVLLCALLRAAAIPARAASGLVYVDNFAQSDQVFGYHMWTQALLTVKGQPTWVDLDATIDAEHAFDATHICLATSSLSDGDSINSMATLAPMIGNLRITVEPAP